MKPNHRQSGKLEYEFLLNESFRNMLGANLFSSSRVCLHTLVKYIICPYKNVFTCSFEDNCNHTLLLVFRKLKVSKEKCSDTMGMSLKRKKTQI